MYIKFLIDADGVDHHLAQWLEARAHGGKASKAAKIALRDLMLIETAFGPLAENRPKGDQNMALSGEILDNTDEDESINFEALDGLP